MEAELDISKVLTLDFNDDATIKQELEDGETWLNKDQSVEVPCKKHKLDGVIVKEELIFHDEEINDDARTSYLGDCNNESIKERRVRFTKLQQALLLDFIEQNQCIVSCKGSGNLKQHHLKTKWNKLTKLLNDCDGGPQRTTSQWQKCLRNWKCLVRSKRNKLSKKPRGEDKSSDLTPFDERLLATLDDDTLMDNRNHTGGVGDCSNHSGTMEGFVIESVRTSNEELSESGQDSSDGIMDAKPVVRSVVPHSTSSRGNRIGSKNEDKTFNTFLTKTVPPLERMETTLSRIEITVGKVYEMKIRNEKKGRLKEEREKEAHEWKRELYKMKKEKYIKMIQFKKNVF